MRDKYTISPRDAEWRKELRESVPVKERTSIPRTKMPELEADYRITTMRAEVNQGLSETQAVEESRRCLDCIDPGCVTGCPVQINIPGFIKNIERGNFTDAYATLKETSALPAVCGRVCPQEKQCESKCLYNKMRKPPVAIGWLERFAADRCNSDDLNGRQASNGIKIAVVGSGPAGLSFAGDMARRGYEITVYEALHEIGGVLKYGIPEFRLPNDVVDREIEALKKSGVRFETNVIIGKTYSYDDLLQMDYRGVFVASGAGLPNFMGIPGENLIGVMSSNEYLTRINLMGAGRKEYMTPVLTGRNVAVIGGGNTAMDSVRTARRMGAERAMIIYRRTEDEMPARKEEVMHAKEEGVEFMTLFNPIEYLADESGRVCTMRVQHMALGDPDDSGRRRPIPVEGDIREIPVDMVIVSVGVSPNPLIPDTIEGLQVTKRGTLEVDEQLRTTQPLIFAGGDIVRGGATVILAMGDGRRAAESMHLHLSQR